MNILTGTTAATALSVLLSLSAPVYATPTSNTIDAPAVSDSDNTVPKKKNMKEYPEMSDDDCKNLPSHRKSYKKSEYLSRKEYCASKEKMGEPGPATEQHNDKMMKNNEGSVPRNSLESVPATPATPNGAEGTTGNTTAPQ